MNNLAPIFLILTLALALFTLFINYKVNKAKRMLGRAEIYRQIGADHKNWVNQVKQVIVALHAKVLQYKSEKNQIGAAILKIKNSTGFLMKETTQIVWLEMYQRSRRQIKWLSGAILLLSLTTVFDVLQH